MAKKRKKKQVSYRWVWEIYITISRKDGEVLLLDYFANFTPERPYNEAELDEWIDQIRKEAMKEAKSSNSGVDLRKCNINVDWNLKKSYL